MSSPLDPVLFPNWVWLLGSFLILAALTWGTGLLIAYRRSSVVAKAPLRSLSEIRQRRYSGLIDQVETRFRDHEMSLRDAHLAVAAIIRAAASERLDVNLESTTVNESQRPQIHWPLLVEALEWCEEPSFGSEPTADETRLQSALSAARGIVAQ